VPVTVACRVLKLHRQHYYAWLSAPVTDAELAQAYRANALFVVGALDPGDDLDAQLVPGGPGPPVQDVKQAGLARVTGIPQSSLSRYIGETRTLTIGIDTARALARALGSDLVDVIRQARELA
jgi:hypothetical protein